MSGYAMFSLKDPSLLAFDRRRSTEQHNLMSVYGIQQAPCDTQMRKRLDPIEPDSLRPGFSEVFRRAQRGKLLEDMVYMEDCLLVSGDGTTYFVSENLSSPSCLTKTCSKTGKLTYSLQTYAAVIVHPDRKEVIPLPPEPIFNHDGDNKNDCYAASGITVIMPSAGLCRVGILRQSRLRGISDSHHSTYRHNQRLSRKVSKGSEGRYRSGAWPVAVAWASACSLSRMSACK
jgi:hypothetical protein